MGVTTAVGQQLVDAADQLAKLCAVRRRLQSCIAVDERDAGLLVGIMQRSQVGSGFLHCRAGGSETVHVGRAAFQP